MLPHFVLCLANFKGLPARHFAKKIVMQLLESRAADGQLLASCHRVARIHSNGEHCFHRNQHSVLPETFTAAKYASIGQQLSAVCGVSEVYV